MTIALYVLTTLLFLAAMTLAGRAHGVGVLDENNQPTGWPSWSRTYANVMFGVAFALGNYALFGVWGLALIGGAISVAGFATGHGNVFGMQGVVPGNDDPEQIERWGGRALYQWLHRNEPANPIHAPAYSDYIMGLKGLIVGLPVAPIGFLLYWLWSLAYRISWKTANGTARGEWLSGTAAGLTVLLAFIVRLLLLSIS